MSSLPSEDPRDKTRRWFVKIPPEYQPSAERPTDQEVQRLAAALDSYLRGRMEAIKNGATEPTNLGGTHATSRGGLPTSLADHLNPPALVAPNPPEAVVSKSGHPTNPGGGVPPTLPPYIKEREVGIEDGVLDGTTNSTPSSERSSYPIQPLSEAGDDKSSEVQDGGPPAKPLEPRLASLLTRYPWNSGAEERVG